MTTPQAETEALLPCPFCGGEPIIKSHRWANDTVKAHYVHCQKCNVNSHGRNTVEKTVAFWNTRAALTPKPVEGGEGDEALIRGITLAALHKKHGAPNADKSVNAAEDAMRRRLVSLRERARNCAVASLGWENRAKIAEQNWANAEAARMKQHVELEDTHRELATSEARVAALEAALKDADGWLPIALCPTDGVWRLVKLSDGNEAVAAFDGVGLLSKKRWQTKVFLTHRPACPSPINDLVTQPARDVFLIADLENGVYPTHFRPNDTVFGLPALNGAAT